VSFKTGYLSPRELDIWRLKRKESQSEIGRILGISRQAVHKTLPSIDEKIELAFNEVLDTYRLKPVKINVVDGVMEAYSPAYQLPVIISLSQANGMRVWYLYEGKCDKCDLIVNCRNLLRNEIQERNIQLEPGDERLEPTKLAIKVFSRYLEEDE
jgi:predicted DNA-binding protein YlxM (UPF0122 family)